jgi:hypothetical protein
VGVGAAAAAAAAGGERAAHYVMHVTGGLERWAVKDVQELRQRLSEEGEELSIGQIHPLPGKVCFQLFGGGGGGGGGVVGALQRGLRTAENLGVVVYVAQHCRDVHPPTPRPDGLG